MQKQEILLNKYEEKFLKDLCNKMYKNFSNNHIDIFLCGGDVNEDTVRKKVRDYLKSEKYIMIFYPEKVFVEYFNLNSESDYLTLETILAENVDFICIVCESPGSIAELGAFSINKKVRPKIIAMIDEKYKNDESFINLGPVKHLLNNDKSSVKHYSDENIEEICAELQKKFKQHLKEYTKPRTIDKITGMFYFISLLLYLFKELDKDKLFCYVKYVVEKLENPGADFEFIPIYSATEKILFNENFIQNKTQKTLELTKSGSEFIYDLMNKNENPIYNLVISDIIKYKYYKSYHYSS